MVTRANHHSLMLALITCMMPSATGCHAAPSAPAPAQEDSAVPGPKLEVAISVESVAYRGLPFLVQVNVKNLSQPVDTETIAKLKSKEERELATRQRYLQAGLPRFEFYDSMDPLGVRVRTGSGRLLEESKQPDRRPHWTRDPQVFDLPRRTRVGAPTNEWRGFVVDLGQWISALDPGRYQISIAVYPFGPSTYNWESKPSPIRVVDVSAAVRQKLVAAKAPIPRPERNPVSAEWMGKEVDFAAVKEALPPEAYAATVFHRFVSGVWRASDIRKADVSLLDNVPTHVRPTAEWLRYEVAKGKKDEVAAKAIRARVEKNHPEVLWRLADADEGDGLLSRHLPQSPPP